jgi:hypothetical protein
MSETPAAIAAEALINEYVVCALPLEHPYHPQYAIKVRRHAGDEWVIIDEDRYDEDRYLDAGGQWDTPGNRAWWDSHLFSEDEALRLAKAAALLVRYKGHLATDIGPTGLRRTGGGDTMH